MKSTSDLFNEIIPLGRLIHMVNQKKDRLLNEYLSPLDITAAQFKVVGRPGGTDPYAGSPGL